MPAERIAAVRIGCGAEFDAFRAGITAAAGELAGLTLESADPEVVAAYLDQVVARDFERPLADLRSAMHGLGVETVLSAAGMKFALPAAVATLSGSLAVGQPVVAAAGGPAFALAGLGRSWKQGHETLLADSPGSYLLRVDKELKPRSLLVRVQDLRRHDDRTTCPSAMGQMWACVEKGHSWCSGKRGRPLGSRDGVVGFAQPHAWAPRRRHLPVQRFFDLLRALFPTAQV
ncbi:DUF6236 family protein [Streptomyces sp. NBC_01515]|uniref:DUF6236 family protein n=1 Tax=Streptomyces sp. NBC_01515 TaxID=2903890 RepID=UPI00386DDB79